VQINAAKHICGTHSRLGKGDKLEGSRLT